jgi:S1-C subfamily serine protease
MLKSIARVARSIALTVAIVYGAAITPELHNHYLRYEVGESVVQVLHPEQFGGGTGFAIQGKSGKDYIMTNRHVCEVGVDGMVRIQVPGRKKTLMKRIIYKDTVHDLCLIDGVKGLAPISIGSDLVEGNLLYVVGHPGLRKLTTSVGEYIGRESVELIVEAETRAQCPGKVIELSPIQQFFMGVEFVCIRSYEALATSAVIYGGNSGSPVVNKWGNLIGVAFAGSTQQERDNYIVPLFYVKRLLNKF